MRVCEGCGVRLTLPHLTSCRHWTPSAQQMNAQPGHWRRYITSLEEKIDGLAHFTLPNGEQIDLTDAAFVLRLVDAAMTEHALSQIVGEGKALPDTAAGSALGNASALSD